MNNLFMKRLDLAIGLSHANTMDILDEKNISHNYWEGYRDALIEIKFRLNEELK
jgi:hypothetical protein